MRVVELLSKYQEILRLRLAAPEAGEEPPRTELAALARTFPGALRELDELPLDEVRARIAALEAARDDDARILPWMVATARYHALTRGALCAKSWLAGRKQVTESLSRAFREEAGALCWAVDALAWQDELGRIAEPPRGRVTDLVFCRIAAEMGVLEEDARALVFPQRRKRKTG